MNVSVVIPAHNAEAYLAQTLGSVLDQTHPPDEIIVIDDGSTDGTLSIARRFAGASDRVRAYSQASGSAAQTRHLGGLHARGEALMFLDADDVLSPPTLEALGDALRREPGGVALGPWARMEQREGRWIERSASCRSRRPQHAPLAEWLRGWYHPPCSVLWSRQAYERSGGWDPRSNVNDDGDIIMRAMVNGAAITEATEGLSYYRRLPEGQVSLSGKRFTAAGLEARILVVRKIMWQLRLRGKLEGYRAPLTDALAKIADDAGGEFPELARRARALARRCRPSRGRQLIRAVRRGAWGVRQGLGGQSPPPPATSQAKAVRFGLDRAAEVLDASPDAPPPGALEQPMVTVILPTYNRAALLPRAIESVLRQTLDDLELLIIDDASTDDTESVVAAAGDPRVRYLKQPENGGAGAARNRGLREARGRFIAFLDSDDAWRPEKLERQIRRFEELDDRVGLIYTGVEFVNDRGERRVKRPSARGDLYETLLLTNVIRGGGSNAMIRREVVPTIGFFDESLPAIEDYDYWLRIGRFFEFDFVNAPLVCCHVSRQIERKSLNVAENLDARAMFYRKHADEMRRAGVAHLFLLRSARRHVTPPFHDPGGARRLALRALLTSPRPLTVRQLCKYLLGR